MTINAQSPALGDIEHSEAFLSSMADAGCAKPAPPGAPVPCEHELDHFLGRYREEWRPAQDHAPDLYDSLAILAAAPDLQHALGLLPKRVNALIEGYAGSRNAEALQAFLALAGVRDMDIVAIDLFDLPATYRRLSMTLPNMRFIQADACSLGAVAADGEFDVVVQDFLLNCLPPADAPRLLAEVARVLAPEGRFILSVTDSSGLQTRPALTPERLACDWGVRWDRSASYLSCIVPDPLLRQDALRALAGCIVADQAREQHTLIAAPHGRFEFFVPWAQTERQLNDAGFRVLLAQTQWGRDDHGLDCHRHRIIAAHR